MVRLTALLIVTVLAADLLHSSADNNKATATPQGGSRLTSPPSGTWISDSGYRVCTLQVTPLHNEFASRLKQAERTEEFTATLTIEPEKHESHPSVRSIGFFWDRQKSSVVMNFDDVRSYNFTGALDERGETIFGEWSPMIACGREFKRLKPRAQVLLKRRP